MADSRRSGRWLRLGLRARLTVAATALVATALLVGGLVLTAALGRTLDRSLDDSARQHARDVAALVQAGTLPETLPVSGDTVAVQVLDAQDRVVAASPGGDRLVPVVTGPDLAAARSGRTVSLSGARLGTDGTLRVVAVRSGSAADPRTVLVAVSSSDAAGSLHVVRLALLVGLPLLVAGFAVACWWLLGAALRPVEELRRGAEEISGAAATDRLPVPAARDEIHDLAVTLNGMVDRLAASSARQRSFVSDAAHELRNPIASIRTQLEVARLHPDDAAWSETVDGALADLERLSGLVDDLLLLARLDERPAHTRSDVDLAELVQQVAATPRRLPVDLVAPAAAGETEVSGDRDALTRALENLLANAERYAARRVAVEVCREAATVAVVVRDDGPGIPESQRERVFERFARLDESRSRDAGGAGLGLPIVREIVLAHGGTVTLGDASPGLRVEVRLPALDR